MMNNELSVLITDHSSLIKQAIQIIIHHTIAHYVQVKSNGLLIDFIALFTGTE